MTLLFFVNPVLRENKALEDINTVLSWHWGCWSRLLGQVALQRLTRALMSANCSHAANWYSIWTSAVNPQLAYQLTSLRCGEKKFLQESGNAMLRSGWSRLVSSCFSPPHPDRSPMPIHLAELWREFPRCCVGEWDGKFWQQTILSRCFVFVSLRIFSAASMGPHVLERWPPKCKTFLMIWYDPVASPLSIATTVRYRAAIPLLHPRAERVPRLALFTHLITTKARGNSSILDPWSQANNRDWAQTNTQIRWFYWSPINMHGSNRKKEMRIYAWFREDSILVNECSCGSAKIRSGGFVNDPEG